MLPIFAEIRHLLVIHLCIGLRTNIESNNKLNTKDIKVFFSLVFMEIISSTNRRPQRSLSSQSLGKY